MPVSIPVNPPAPSKLGLLGWILLCAAAGALGAIASVDAATFYAVLAKPPWAPSAGVFGPVWTVLYLLMAIAAWIAWRAKGWARASGALTLFIAQLVCNALWSWLFFAWHRGGLALVDILLLDVLLICTMIGFSRVRTLAAVLLAPYLAWVVFATALTVAVWRHNPTLL